MDYSALKDVYIDPVTGVQARSFVQHHPDGQAWKKCCRGARVKRNPDIVNCAYADKRRTKKDDLAGRMTCDGSHDSTAATQPFVCSHRHDNGYLRVCAGWHSCHGEKNEST
jgi:hypothetical protein